MISGVRYGVSLKNEESIYIFSFSMGGMPHAK